MVPNASRNRSSSDTRFFSGTSSSRIISVRRRAGVELEVLVPAPAGDGSR